MLSIEHKIFYGIYGIIIDALIIFIAVSYTDKASYVGIAFRLLAIFTIFIILLIPFIAFQSFLHELGRTVEEDYERSGSDID